MAMKVKIRLAGRPIRGEQLYIPVIRTAIMDTPSPARRAHLSRRKKRTYNKLPLRTTYAELYGPMKQVTIRPYQPFIGPELRHEKHAKQKDVATSISQHSKMHPKAGTKTKGDNDKQKSIAALGRINKFVVRGLHWTPIMIALLLRVFFNIIVLFNWNWTATAEFIAKVFAIKRDTVYRFCKKYLASDVIAPEELEVKIKGRGSETFKLGGADRYSEMKERHLRQIVEFVTERNVSQRGMCNVKSIQANLLSWCGKYFEPHVVLYALKTRLGFKYRTPLCRRIVFSPERVQLAFTFVGKMDRALKEERAGTALVGYMDETYCHLSHLPGKMWYRDVDVGTARAERSRNKGSLQIILHAMFKFGWIVVRAADGQVPVLEEWHRGKADTCEMVFRGKIAGGDYHENMDGTMFMKWINTRFVTVMKKLHPGKKVYLVMDNAPYHHGRSDDSFFCTGRPKEEIQAKLKEMKVKTMTVQPYADIPDAFPTVPSPDGRMSAFEGWAFFERSTGECFMVDGLSDEGLGNVVVHTRIGATRFGSVESAFEADFRRLIQGDFCLVGYGEPAMLYLRSVMGRGAKLAKDNSDPVKHRRACKRYLTNMKKTKWRYPTDKLHEKYNGAGKKGTGGPNAELLRKTVDAYIAKHHPRLHMTEVMQRFEELGWEIIFTVPYWAKSQPIELVWAYIKNYVARMYFPGRTHKDLRKQILAGMYGGVGKHGETHTGLTAELAQKMIAHTHKHINEFLRKTEGKHNFRGDIGYFL